MPDTIDIPSLKNLDIGLTGFEQHVSDTWIPGWGRVMEFFDDPTVRLEEEYGEENIDPARFDHGLYREAIARKVLGISLGRIETALRHSYKGDLDLQKKVVYQGLGGKRRDGIYARVKIDMELAMALQFYIFGDGEAGARLSDLHDGNPPRHYSDFAAFIEGRYRSRPGFSSYESTDVAEWARETSGFTNFRPDRRGHKLGTLFDFVMQHHESEYGDEWDPVDIYYAVMDTDVSLAEHYKGDLPERR